MRSRSIRFQSRPVVIRSRFIRPRAHRVRVRPWSIRLSARPVSMRSHPIGFEGRFVAMRSPPTGLRTRRRGTRARRPVAERRDRRGPSRSACGRRDRHKRHGVVAKYSLSRELQAPVRRRSQVWSRRLRGAGSRPDATGRAAVRRFVLTSDDAHGPARRFPSAGRLGARHMIHAMKPPTCPRCTCREVITRNVYQTRPPVRPEGDAPIGAKLEQPATVTSFRCRYCGHEWSAA
jgi:hypothetical protein